MKFHKRKVAHGLALGFFFAYLAPLQAEEGKSPADAVKLENIALTVVTLRNLRELCSAYFVVNAELSAKLETVFVESGKVGNKAEFDKQLMQAAEKIKKQMSSAGQEDWCKNKKTSYSAVDPNLFK
jgi:hypothetical protein